MEFQTNFADRLSDLIKESGKSLNQIAKESGVSSGGLSKYQNDQSLPDANSLLRLADYFKVTTDYLLCRTDVRKPDETLQAIHDQTGLSEKVIIELINWNSDKKTLKGYWPQYLSVLMEHPQFPAMMRDISNYLVSRRTEKQALLNKKGKIALTAIDYEQAALWSITRTFANMIEETLK